MDKTDSNTQRLGQPSRDTSSAPSVGQPSVYQHAQPPSLHVWSNEFFNEKSDKGFHAQSQRALTIPSTPSLPTHQSRLPSQYSSRASSTPFSISSRPAPSIAYTRPRGLRITNLFKPWIPIILYAITSLGFLAAIAFWKTEVFEGEPRSSLDYIIWLHLCLQAWTSSHVGSSLTSMSATLPSFFSYSSPHSVSVHASCQSIEFLHLISIQLPSPCTPHSLSYLAILSVPGPAQSFLTALPSPARSLYLFSPAHSSVQAYLAGSHARSPSNV